MCLKVKVIITRAIPLEHQQSNPDDAITGYILK